jgi:hypothetical protein
MHESPHDRDHVIRANLYDGMNLVLRLHLFYSDSKELCLLPMARPFLDGAR